MRTSSLGMGKWVLWGSLTSLALLLAFSTVGRVDEARGQAAADKPTVLGSWKLICECADGMVVDIVSTGADSAVGRIKTIGKGGEFHYTQGEEILRIKADAGGAWTGQLHWKNTAGEKRWQPITLRFMDSQLHGVTANEHCYEYMTRPN